MPTKKSNKISEVLGKIFRDAETAFGLKEFEEINIEEALEITEEDKGKFYLKDLKTGKQRLVWNDEKQAGKPEEIVRQLWLHKLQKVYKYPLDRMDTEKAIHFGREVHTKAADIVVYQKDKSTPYIIIEVKSPTGDKGIEQLKGYLNAEGAEIGVWSNGTKRVILYRPYPREFNDTLPELPRADQTIDELLEAKKTYLEHTTTKINLKEIIETMEELVLANAGVDVFSEVFKLIYAKLYDEVEAKMRPDQEVFFRKYKDPRKTYDIVSDLFRHAVKKWPGTFLEQDAIKLSPEHLSIVVGELERARLFGSDLAVIDEAFEHLIPEVAKGKKGQYFTPRHVIAMAVKMLNPNKDEFVIDPAAGSGGFLIQTMNWVREQYLRNSDEATKEYAKNFLWGIDFADEISKVSRALMLIAGDGRSHLFKLNTLDPREWHFDDKDRLDARGKLMGRLKKFDNQTEDSDNERTFHYFDFDVLLTNPPFAGEIRDQGILRQYDLARKKGKLVNKVERHILFIERALDMLKFGGRMAVVLPQGVLNNTNMEYIRQFIMDKARILAVVGLHGNTFKPHTGTKTSVLFLQKWGGVAGEPLKDYPIFMAVSKKGGKDNSGEYIYRKDAAGNFHHDSRGRKVLDHDLNEIADGFLKFAKEQKINL